MQSSFILSQLTPEDSPEDIIAYVDNPSGYENFTLVVKPAAEGSLDEIILAFAIIEQAMRLEASLSWQGRRRPLG